MNANTLEDALPIAPPSGPGDPTWAIALLFPRQGDWTEDEYLALDTNLLVELANGNLEVHSVSTLFHQGIVRYLFLLLHEFVKSNVTGEVLFAPLRIRLFPRTIREPDIVYLRPGRISNRRRPPQGADLAIEVVSEGEENRMRDLITKREEYARAGVGEYWIVDPLERRITVLTLEGSAYRVHGEFGMGEYATSAMLPAFKVNVTATFAAGDGNETR